MPHGPYSKHKTPGRVSPYDPMPDWSEGTAPVRQPGGYPGFAPPTHGGMVPLPEIQGQGGAPVRQPLGTPGQWTPPSSGTAPVRQPQADPRSWVPPPTASGLPPGMAGPRPLTPPMGHGGAPVREPMGVPPVGRNAFGVDMAAPHVVPEAAQSEIQRLMAMGYSMNQAMQALMRRGQV